MAHGFRNSDAVRAAVRALADLGVGTRETARLLQMAPNHVHYYRKALGIVPLEDVELFGALPPEVQQTVLAARVRTDRPPPKSKTPASEPE